MRTCKVYNKQIHYCELILVLPLMQVFLCAQNWPTQHLSRCIYPCLFPFCGQFKLCRSLDTCLPEKERLSILLCKVAEAAEHKQQVLLKLSRCSGYYQLPQKVWIIEVHFLDAVFARLVLQDPIVVDDEFSELRVKCCFIPELVQPPSEVSIPLIEMKLIAFI